MKWRRFRCLSSSTVTCAGMVMINGTNGEVVTAEQDIGVLFGGTNYLKLYFGQTGMEIEEIKFVCTQAF